LKFNKRGPPNIIHSERKAILKRLIPLGKEGINSLPNLPNDFYYKNTINFNRIRGDKKAPKRDSLPRLLSKWPTLDNVVPEENFRA